MSTDLTFMSMSRQGTATVKKDEYKIGEVSKDGKLKSLSEDDKQDTSDEMKVTAVASQDEWTDDLGRDDEDDDGVEHVDYFA